VRRARARAAREAAPRTAGSDGARRLSDLRERLGLHRVVDPPGALPQPAWRLDPHAPLRAGETEVAVERLSVDAVSFRQLWDGDEATFAERLLRLVDERGKLHNPDTDSGGTLLGTVTSVGEDRELAVGDRIVALASTSAIPLALERVLAVRPQAAEVLVEGRAVLAAALPAARAPDDLDPALAVAAADVAGAPGLVHDLLPDAGTCVVIGASGSAGLLACAAARERGARVVGVDLDPAPLERTGVAEAAQVDARDALAVAAALAGIEADVVAQVATAPGCEASAVAAVATEGTIVYFSLATSFQRCVNVADVFGKRPRMVIATALRLHHAPLAWELLRRHEPVRAELGRRLGIS
jgi:L-erythro-3,5-diaminohexanoate dehydrogenase